MQRSVLPKLASLIFLFALISSSTAIVGAASASANLKGRVVAPDGAVIAGAKVRLTNSVNGRIAETTTDANGLFTLFNVPHNQYVLTVESKDFQIYTENLDVHSDSVLE